VRLVEIVGYEVEKDGTAKYAMYSTKKDFLYNKEALQIP
jgi:hypothetical protein